MVQINVSNGQGVTQAIASKLNMSASDCKKVDISIWNQVMSEVKNAQAQGNNIYSGGEDTNKIAYNGGNNNWKTDFKTQTGVFEIAENFWNKIVELLTGKPAVTNTSKVQSTENVKDVKAVSNVNLTDQTEAVPSEKLKTDVQNAQKVLNDNLKNMSSTDLREIGISEAKRDRLIGYINNIHYEDEKYGSAQAKKDAIWVSTSASYSSPEDMIKLLVHEANHCDENYLFEHPEMSDNTDTRHRDSEGNPVSGVRINTIEEEKMCERTALLTTAKLMDKGVLSGNYAPYTPPPQFRAAGEDLSKYSVTNYLKDRTQLENDLNGWILRSYPGVVENLSGDVTIRHMGQEKGLDIKSGDVVKIGDKSYTIGEKGLYLSAMGRTTACQLAEFDSSGNSKGIAGNIVFDGMEPSQNELQSLYGYGNFVKQNDDGSFVMNTNNTPVQIIRNGEVIYNGHN